MELFERSGGRSVLAAGLFCTIQRATRHGRRRFGGSFSVFVLFAALARTLVRCCSLCKHLFGGRRRCRDFCTAVGPAEAIPCRRTHAMRWKSSGDGAQIISAELRGDGVGKSRGNRPVIPYIMVGERRASRAASRGTTQRSMPPGALVVLCRVMTYGTRGDYYHARWM